MLALRPPAHQERLYKLWICCKYLPVFKWYLIFRAERSKVEVTQWKMQDWNMMDQIPGLEKLYSAASQSVLLLSIFLRLFPNTPPHYVGGNRMKISM